MKRGSNQESERYLNEKAFPYKYVPRLICLLICACCSAQKGCFAELDGQHKTDNRCLELTVLIYKYTVVISKAIFLITDSKLCMSVSSHMKSQRMTKRQTSNPEETLQKWIRKISRLHILSNNSYYLLYSCHIKGTLSGY